MDNNFEGGRHEITNTIRTTAIKGGGIKNSRAPKDYLHIKAPTLMV